MTRRTGGCRTRDSVSVLRWTSPGHANDGADTQPDGQCEFAWWFSVIANPENPRLFVESMWKHVLQPVRTAIGIAKGERTELTAEQTAFRAFIGEVQRIKPVPAVSERGIQVATQQRATAVRSAYRETVLDVDHYETVYGEPLLENVAAELGSEAAAVLRPDNGVVVTPQAKQVLLTAAEQCLERRETIGTNVEAEQESLESARSQLQCLLESLDGTVVPTWYDRQFESELEALIDSRQRHLHRPTASADNYELCAYLYADEPWQFPVLTAIARLRDVTTVETD